MDGTATWNDLGTPFQDNPITVSLYAQRNKLLGTAGWKDGKQYVWNPKKLTRMINQARLKSARTKPVYKYSFQVPRNHAKAVDTEKLEIKQLMDYEAFKDLGLNAPITEGHTKIPVHFAYDVKHDGHQKARLVAGRHCTSTPVNSVYSGVVSLTGIQVVTLLAELNDLEIWGTDIG